MKKISCAMMFMALLFACSNEDEEVKEFVKITAIKLDKTELTLQIGEEYTFKVSKTPENATDPAYYWFLNSVSEDFSAPSIGRIDKSGKFIATNAGTAILTIQANRGIPEYENPPITFDCVITVDPIKAESLELSNKQLTMKKGDKVELTYKLSPKGAADNLKWNVSDEKAVSIDVKGDGVIFVTALKAGEAKVYTTINGQEYACNVTVEAIKAESITLNPVEKTVKQAEKFSIIASVLPENADNSELTWTSSNESIATVDQDGNVQTFMPGTCSILVATSDNSVKAECKVTVIERPLEELITAGVYGSSTSINGYTTGDIVATFYNNSDKTVEVTEFTMYDTGTNKVVYQQKDCGFVEYKKPLQYELRFSMVYKPLFVWKYTSSGKSYEVSYQM